MDIADYIRELSGSTDWAIPEPDSKRWVRFDCPFCTIHGKRANKGKTATLSYDEGWFRCFRCERFHSMYSLSYPSNDALLVRLLEEHRETITNIVEFTKRRYGAWVSRGDLMIKAKEMIWTYAYMPEGNPNDAGKYDEWKAQANGDDEALKRFVGQALKRDLMTYGRREMAWKRKHPGGLTDIPDDGVKVMSFDEPDKTKMEPYTRSRGHSTSSRDDGAAFMAMAEDERVPFTSWGLHGCELQRNGLGPFKGHCSYCDLALKARTN